MYKVHFTSAFNKMLRDLNKAGGEGQKAVQKAQAAMAQAQIYGKIDLQRTHNGESRLPNIEKYGLSDTYRLVVQLIDGMENVRAFLFVGDHDDAEAWLDAHREYRWIQRNSDQVLEFIYAPQGEEAKLMRGFDLKSSEEDMNLPLLRDLNDSEIDSLIEGHDLKEYVQKISSSDWEMHFSVIENRIMELANDEDLTVCLWSLLEIAHGNDPEKEQQMRLTMAQYHSEAKIIDSHDLSEALQNPVNAEKFIEYDEEMGDFWENHPNADWDDWMIFLNPKQKEWASKELNGPARLCGVSGSGKTCVLLHRAKFLAIKYKKPIAILTLTTSMQKLLDNLLVRLCGLERSLIYTFTIASFIRDEMADKFLPNGLRNFSDEKQFGERKDWLIAETNSIFKSEEFNKSPWSNFSDRERQQFVLDEFNYVRTRLTPNQYEEYCSSNFKRIGRGIPLVENMRRIVLREINGYESLLTQNHWVDHESLTHKVIEALPEKNYSKYRAILVDEVQDLTQNDLRAIGSLITTEETPVKDSVNGLFLVGDGAQTIYKNGFSLKKLGINVSGRSFAFKKNYRNTRQILEAAYALIKNFDCSNLDEDDVTRPILPELAKQNGGRPQIIKTYTQKAECTFVVDQILQLMDMGESIGNVCVIGLNKYCRKSIQESLKSRKVPYCEIRENVQTRNDVVKISTIESAKGHEFSTVFITGLAIPNDKVLSEDDLSIEASRLYVAMTRACNNLFLTYCSSPGYVPSHLLMYIQDFCEEKEIRNDYAIRNSEASHASI